MKELLSNPIVKRLAEIFHGAGWQLYAVGGSVRDLASGEDIDDLDFTTPASPDEIEELVSPLGPVWDVGKKFGTIGVEIDKQKVEITTFRADSYDGESRKPEVVFGKTLTADLARRDFTMNAMAVDVWNGALIDPFCGMTDLLAGVLRTPVDPVQTMQDDPLRALRALRFAVTRDMDLDASVMAAIYGTREALGIVSQERKTAELMKIAARGTAPLIRAHELSLALGVSEHLFGRLVIDRRVGPSLLRGLAALAAISVHTELSLFALMDMRFSNQDAAWISTVHEACREMPLGRTEARRLVRRMPDDVLEAVRDITLLRGKRVLQLDSAFRFDKDWLRLPLPVDGNDFVQAGLKGTQIGVALRAVEDEYIHNRFISREHALTIGMEEGHGRG